MPLVTPLSAEHNLETKKLAEFFNETLGFCPNSVLTMQRRPAISKAFINLNKAVMANEGKVTSALKRMIAWVSSNATGCRYCQAPSGDRTGYCQQGSCDGCSCCYDWDCCGYSSYDSQDPARGCEGSNMYQGGALRMEDTSEATLIDIIFSSNKAWGTRDKTDGTGNIFATSSTPKLFLVGMSMPLLSMGVVPIGSNPLPNGNGCCNLCLSVG